MWTIEEFRLAVLVSFVGFMALAGIACVIATKWGKAK